MRSTATGNERRRWEDSSEFWAWLTMLGLAYIFSTDRKAIRLKTVLWGFGLQLAFAVFVLRFSAGRRDISSSPDTTSICC